ncbi:MAG: tRNA 2-thiocytidine biosynthesis TtcA family protein [Lachnospiraceae bacterium]|nr:tRNA 2-thiocytidine biosynthesis TtcA family protein [Lachnospiraceae bacterium]
MKLQQLYSHTRKAVDDYHMIEDGDKIAIGISGGKDSLTLLYALAGLKRFYPKKFDLCAISVNLGFQIDYDPIRKLCEDLSVPFTVVDTEIARIIFEERKEGSPCSLCAKMRKGALNEKAKELGCNKIAYAHHKDDVIETMLMSLIYEGRFYTFAPVTEWDRMGLQLIRPLIYVNECDIVGFKNKYILPTFKNPCEADGNTTREYATELIKSIDRKAPGIRERLFHAVTDSKPLTHWKKEISSSSDPES